MNKLVKGLVLGSIAAVSATAFAAPKMSGDTYGIAGVGFNGYSYAGSPIAVQLGAGKKITKDVSAEVTATVTPGGEVARLYDSCAVKAGPQVGVDAQAIYHIPLDVAGVKPYIGAGFGYYASPSYKYEGCLYNDTYRGGWHGVGFGYTAGLEYAMSNKTKLYVDAGGVGTAWGGSLGVKMGF